MQSFSKCQTFYIDPGVVANAPQVMLSAVDLFFQSKPARNNNASGLLNPGVSLFICETQFGQPKIENIQYTVARVEYDQIATTSNATLGTKFRLKSPVPVKTGREYAIVVMFDGSENFILWSSKVGDFLVDTKKVSGGPSGKYIGNYYDYVNTPQSFSPTNPAEQNINGDQYQSNWTPLPDTDLKFRVYCARYAHNGHSVSSNTTIPSTVQVIRSPVLKDYTTENEDYVYPASCLEMIIFDQTVSVKEKFVGGQWCYQNTVSYPGGYANGSSFIAISVNGSDRITANTQYPNGTAFTWRGVYPTVGLSGASGNDSPYIVVKDTSIVNIRRVVSVVSNTILQVSEPVTFINSAAQFMLSPVGQIDSFNKSSPFGDFNSIVVLTNSSANSKIRFVNNSISNTTIVAGGTGYSNSDVFYVTGYESVATKVEGGYVAVANMVTNSTGGITALYFSNIGCGFITGNVAILSAANTTPTINTSAGSGANVTLGIGSSVKTELRNNVFNKCRIANFSLADVIPYFDIDHPPGSDYDIRMLCGYYVVQDAAASSGQVYYVNNNANSQPYPINMFVRNLLGSSNVIPAFVSRSNEFITRYSNGAVNDTTSPGLTSNAMVMIVNTHSNSDFTCVSVNSIPTLSLSTYLVNNDYTNEHTDQGNAWARHITTKVEFGRLAEDLLVYLTAYKPSDVDMQVYARIHNSSDSEAFEDKNWTRLEQKFTANLVSSSTDREDFIELTYGFQAFPNTDFTSNGTVTLTGALTTNVVGSNTAFDVNFVAGDLIKISNPLFPETYMIDTVNSVTNATHLVLTTPVSNVNFLTYGQSVQRVRTYKHQAYNNYLSDNVARYYNSSMVQFDGYDTLQVKVIMLSSKSNIVPKTDDIRFLGVTA